MSNYISRVLNERLVTSGDEPEMMQITLIIEVRTHFPLYSLHSKVTLK